MNHVDYRINGLYFAPIQMADDFMFNFYNSLGKNDENRKKNFIRL